MVAGKRKGLRLAGLSLMALAQPGCVSLQQERLGRGEEPVLVGPAVRDNRTPMDGALACFADHLRARGGKPLVIAVGDVRDYTGKYTVNEGNAITQGGALMVSSALGKLRGAVRIAERFDPAIAERELAYADRRQLGDGKTHELPGPTGVQVVPWLPYFGGSITASDYYVVGGITELNYDIRSGGVELGVTSIGPRARTYTQSVAIDLRIIDTSSLLVVQTISLTKQFTGYETSFGLFRFFGSNLFDINIGAKGQEPLQLGIRTALEEAAMRLVGAVSDVDPDPCMTQATWLTPVPTAEVPGHSGPDLHSATESPLLIGASAINDHGSVDGDAVATDISILFDVGADDLTASSAPTLDQIASLVAHGPVYVSLVARDTEILDPEKRKTLTDRRIAAFTRALARRGIAASRISSIWRPDSADSSIQRVAAGLQRLVRLRVG
ncbi:MAG: hypothetical protein M0R03_00390 [Novosphingobium sp.]|nr:hypothetical protein [Novosphingobium sp.]